jgi:hypothetical protein
MTCYWCHRDCKGEELRPRDLRAVARFYWLIVGVEIGAKMILCDNCRPHIAVLGRRLHEEENDDMVTVRRTLGWFQRVSDWMLTQTQDEGMLEEASFISDRLNDFEKLAEQLDQPWGWTFSSQVWERLQRSAPAELNIGGDS